MINRTIREATISDIDLIADYWMSADESYLTAMGVDLTRMPTREAFSSMLRHQFKLPITEKNAFCLIWEIDSKACGHSNTNPTEFGNEAFFHTHIWHPQYRKGGHGAVFLQATIPVYFQRLHLKKLIGEPYSRNPAPNRLLQRLGFQKTRTYTTVPGSLNFEQEVNRYEMTKQIFNDVSKDWDI